MGEGKGEEKNVQLNKNKKKIVTSEERKKGRKVTFHTARCQLKRFPRWGPRVPQELLIDTAVEKQICYMWNLLENLSWFIKFRGCGLLTLQVHSCKIMPIFSDMLVNQSTKLLDHKANGSLVVIWVSVPSIIVIQNVVVRQVVCAGSGSYLQLQRCG